MRNRHARKTLAVVCEIAAVLAPLWGLAQPPVRALRAIDDPATHTRWLLLPDSGHPGGPGILRISDPEAAASGSGGAIPALPSVVIHAGDRLLILDSTAHASARFEAIAMEPARAGAEFLARLVVNGGRVRAIADAPGRATLATATFQKGRRP